MEITVNSSNKGYICGGNGYYISGQQDGTFVEHGWHIPGEMSGIWMQPIKLIDSYKVRSEIITSNFQKFHWKTSTKYSQKPYGNEFIYENYDNIIYKRSEYIIDRIGILIENKFAQKKQEKEEEIQSFTTNFQIFPHLRGCWLSDQIETDDIDICEWDEVNKCVICWDLAMNKFLSVGFKNSESLHTKIDIDIQKNYFELKITSKTLIDIQLLITGSKKDQKDCLEKLHQLREKNEILLIEKKEKMKEIQSISSISIPDKAIEEMYTWSKFNIYWLYNTIDNLGSGKWKMGRINLFD